MQDLSLILFCQKLFYTLDVSSGLHCLYLYHINVVKIKIVYMKEKCTCNDYRLLTANTGVATISVGSSSLLGSGSVTVLTAGDNGTIVRSLIIKSLQPNLEGMIRIFVDTGSGVINLFREIPIPTYPMISSTPTPAPIWPMIEINLENPLILKAGYSLKASTENSESFNIIVEGLDWAYPQVLPSSCCNYIQELENTGVNRIAVANTKLDGTGAIVNLFTAGGNGSLIKSITIAALQSTHRGMVRFFVSPNNGVTYFLMMEVIVPQTNQSAFEPSFKVLLNEDFYLQAGYIIAASTEKSESFAITIEGNDWSYPI